MYLKSALLFLLVFGFLTAHSSAQTTPNDLLKTIATKDGLFWAGYNNCNYEQLGEYVADDVEFYHDQGGITLGKSALVDSIKNNICGNSKMRVRREADSATIKVFPLKKANVVYGAIISGNHFFLNSYDGQPEKREGIAKFMNLWVVKDGVWKMSRILSYDHNLVPYVNNRKAKRLAQNLLSRFAGEYSGSQTGTSVIEIGKGSLKLTSGNKKYDLYPETGNLFFVKERDLTFEFVAGSRRTLKMIVREGGKVVEEAVRKR